MMIDKNGKKKQKKNRRIALLRFMFLLSFLPYFLPRGQRPGIYRTMSALSAVAQRRHSRT